MFKPTGENSDMDLMSFRDLARREFSAITVSGVPAVQEAMRALDVGKHVVILSGGISLEEEVKLKQAAAERGLMLIGPECWTTIISGMSFGFVNAVRRGPIGIVGTVGDGIQEISCLVDEVGVSQAICIGSRDLSQKVNGIGTLSVLRYLEADEATKVIIVVAKSPTTSVAKRVLEAVREVGKPVVVCFLGAYVRSISRAGITPALTLEDAAVKAVSLARKQRPKETIFSLPARKVEKIVEEETRGFGYGQKYVRGLFSGGTLCDEAMLILQELVGDVYSNVPLKPRLRLPDMHSSKRHTCVDMSAEEFTRGTTHPVVDLKPRCERILREAKDWEIAVLLLDVVLGQGAHPDPAGELVKTIKEARRIADQGGGYLSVVASIVGTLRDPQNLRAQKEKFERAGIIVMPSNAQAARMAALVATKGRAWRKRVLGLSASGVENGSI